MSGSSGVVVFDYTTWAARYPELSASVASQLAQQYFYESTLYCDNSAVSIVPFTDASGTPIRAMLLNMLTAHIAQLNAPMNGAASPQLVGRIASAGQGSVNVSIQNDYPPGTPQWFQQTKYGAAFWAATQQFRTMQYVPAPRVGLNGMTDAPSIWGRRGW